MLHFHIQRHQLSFLILNYFLTDLDIFFYFLFVASRVFSQIIDNQIPGNVGMTSLNAANNSFSEEGGEIICPSELHLYIIGAVDHSVFKLLKKMYSEATIYTFPVALKHELSAGG